VLPFNETDKGANLCFESGRTDQTENRVEQNAQSDFIDAFDLKREWFPPTENWLCRNQHKRKKIPTWRPRYCGDALGFAESGD
jgi:hypothetical protein